NTYLSFYSTHHQCLYRSRYPAHRRAHSFPTRRSSDLHQRELTRLRIRIEDLGREELTRDVQIPRVVRGSVERRVHRAPGLPDLSDRKSTRLNSSHVKISYAVFCLKKKKTLPINQQIKV